MPMNPKQDPLYQHCIRVKVAKQELRDGGSVPKPELRHEGREIELRRGAQRLPN
jgi:hypothetical protein